MAKGKKTRRKGQEEKEYECICCGDVSEAQQECCGKVMEEK